MNWGLRKINIVSAVGVLFLICKTMTAQVAPEKYWIQFTDKDNSPYSVSTPLDYLSQRSIDRRAFQSISITVQDFPVNPIYVQTVKQTATLRVLVSSKWLNGIVIQTTDTSGLNQVLNLPFVDSAGSKSVMSPFLGVKSTKMDVVGFKTVVEDLPQLGAEVIDYGFSETQNKMIHVDYLHDLGYTGSGMVIAVLDAGFYGADTTTILQPLFTENRVLGTWDFVLDQPVDYTQYSNHGAFVLNSMAGNIPGFYVGSAPDASYWLLRTEDAPTENIIEEYNWVAGAEFADSVGADIFNTSLGYTTFDDSTQNHTYADLDGNTTIITIGSDIAASKGVLVVNSAGNSGGNSWRYIGAPADGDSVLAIGAVYPDRVVTGFSSRGPSYDGRVKPNVMAMGGSVPMPIGVDTIFNINGTSFSGPILAGAAACLWQSQNSYTSMDVFHAIEESADQFNTPNDDYGFGIPNFGLAHYFITGVNDISQNGLSINAYPNPTKGIAYFPIIDSDVSVTISNSIGKVVYLDTNLARIYESYQVDFSSFPTGIYFVEIKSMKGVQWVRVIRS